MKAISKFVTLFANNWLGSGCLAVFCGTVLSMALCAPSYATGKVGKASHPGQVISNSGATPGYVLLAPADSTTTFLIDKQGNVKHKWHSTLKPGMSVYMDSLGNLYRAEDMGYHYCGYPGGRIAMYSWNDTLMWADTICSPTFQQCHDIYPMPNGHVLAAVWEKIPYSVAINAGRKGHMASDGLWSCAVVELQPNYQTKTADSIWSWHMWNHIDNTGMSDSTLNVNDIGTPISGDSDWIHMNAVTYNLQLDQIIVSSRNLNEIYIIQHDTSSAVSAGPAGNFLYRWGHAAAYGATTDSAQQLFGQHSPYWIEAGCPNAGQIMINNDGYLRDTTTVNIINPTSVGGVYSQGTGGAFLPDTANWTYTAPGNCFTQTRGSAQQLPNSNVIICAADADTFYEVQSTPPYNVVWQYSLYDVAIPHKAHGGAFRCHQYSTTYVNAITRYQKNAAKK